MQAKGGVQDIWQNQFIEEPEVFKAPRVAMMGTRDAQVRASLAYPCSGLSYISTHALVRPLWLCVPCHGKSSYRALRAVGTACSQSCPLCAVL